MMVVSSAGEYARASKESAMHATGSLLGRRQFGGLVLGAASFVALRPRAAAAEDSLDEALALVSRRGPEFGGGLSNHGPMACEALVALGRPESAVPFAARYARRLDAHPSERQRLSETDLRGALGDPGRVGDLTAFFDRKIEEDGATQTICRFVPRLLPGLCAAGFHGLIRTAHAARSLGRSETAIRRAELAEGLGYWAARYRELPARETASGNLTAAKALLRVRPIPPERRPRGSIAAAFAALDADPSFAPTLGLLDVRDPDRALSEVTSLFARVFLASAGRGNVIAFIHTVTGPAALRLLLPHLPASEAPRAVRYAWQAAAGIFAAFAGSSPGTGRAGATDPPERLADRAIATGDEHAIKLTEACLREHAIRPDPAYLLAARDASERLA
jgi:hypothetical protein